ncbi:hypothetical protein RCZ04_01640 [Capnocytophaga sp. HP1101]
MSITLPPYTTAKNLKECIAVVKEVLDSKAITVSDQQWQDVTLEVMSIAYAKGGDYSPQTIKSFAESYLLPKLK